MKNIVRIKGVYKRKMNEYQAAALIASATVGAGVLGIPYVVAQVGIGIGLVYIVLMGLFAIGMNELIGAITLGTQDDMQLVGYIRKYLGSFAGICMSVLVYCSLFGALTIYFIGQGEILSTLLGGSPVLWTVLFFFIALFLIYTGMDSIKHIQFWLTLLVLGVVLAIAAYSSPHIALPNLQHVSFANLLLPYGVLLFAFHGSSSVPEAKVLLSDNPAGLKRAIRYAGFFSLFLYALFAFVVVGVTGAETTEIATIGLGRVLGEHVLVLGNIFALLAMGTSCLIAGLALRDSFRWDYRMNTTLATALVCGIPLAIFLLGMRHFIMMIDIVGGILISGSLFFLVAAYWQATKYTCSIRYQLHHTLLFVVVAVVALTIGAGYSIWQLFL